jgi:micrococcal nuclease
MSSSQNLSHELVRAGFAWWFRRYSSDATLEALEAEARAARRGLWADPNAVPPWEWRAAVRQGT